MTTYLDIDKDVEKIIKSKFKSTKDKYNKITNELRSGIIGGPEYIKLNGEALLEEAKKRKVINCIPHSVKLENRMRLVFEVYEGPIIIDGNRYDLYISITDAGNHEWNNIPYVKQLSLIDN